MATEKETNQPSLEAGLLENDQLNSEIVSEGPTLYSLKWSIFALAMAVLTQGYLLVSCFPYVAFMCIHLVSGLTEQNAGLYAGVISAMFMIGRVFTSYPWGWVADKYGRKQVFYWSYILSIIFSLGFGLSTNITLAITTRFFLGASNGLISVAKTVVTEVAEGDKALESKIMGLVFGMRGWTYLFSPAVGGYLSDPVKQFPGSYLSTHFHEFFVQYPFFLPNLFGALLCTIGFFAIYFGVKETKPDIIVPNDPNITLAVIWAKPATRDYLISYWLLVFVSIAYEEAIPLYFIATEGGLSLQEKSIGAILTGAGLIFGIFQYLIYHQLTRRFDLNGALVFASVLGAPLAILTPIASLLNANAAVSHINVSTYVFLIFLLGVTKIFLNNYFTSVSLGANRTVSKVEMSAMNALSMLGGSVAQSVGPIVAGSVTSFALTSGIFSPYVGVYVIFSIISIVGVILTLFSYFKLRKHEVE